MSGQDLDRWLESLPPAPPPPPFDRIEAAMAAHAPRTALRRVAWGAAAAAAVLVGVLGFRHGGDATQAEPLAGFVLGPGIAVESEVRPQLAASLPSEVRWPHGAARMVLDARASASVGRDGVSLSAGSRAWFDVQPRAASAPPFVVTTPEGEVRVVGTQFEVDVRGGSLEVAVARGLVEVAATGLPPVRVAAGRRWHTGTATDIEGPLGRWFSTPTLRIEVPPPMPRDEPVPLTLLLGNPGNVPIDVEARDGAPASLWLAWRAPDGAVREVGARSDDWPPAGGSLRLSPLQERRVPVGFLPPLSPAGTYRVSALYRPLDGPSVRSAEVIVEVR